MLKLEGILKEKITQGHFGMEREAIRVDERGVISHKPHPACFGNKLIKKHITTDFSESQVEMITPALDSIEDMYIYVENLYDFVSANLDDEMLWCQSMPCVIDGDIPVAIYEGEIGQQNTAYREMLVEKYGGEKQLISGIHFNFSFGDKFLEELYKQYGKDMDFQHFVDEIYLKVARNYKRYGFLVTYLCACSNVCHKSYDKQCIATLEQKDEDSYYSKVAVSLRNSKWGYRNLADLFPCYDSAKAYVDSINGFIAEGHIAYPKEYYSSLRLKTVDQDINTLVTKGIKYIEIRTIDLNPFCKVGVDIRDIKFIHLFLILMLIMEEEKCDSFQRDGFDAKEVIALKGLDKTIRVDGKEYKAKDKCLEIIDRVAELNKELGLYSDDIMDFQRDKVNNGGYAERNKKISFIDDSLALMKEYKQQSVENAKMLSKERIAELLEE